MSLNIYNNLIGYENNKDISIQKIIMNNSVVFTKAYNEAYSIFFKELIKNLCTEILDFNDNKNIINLDNNTELPTYFNKKFNKKFKIIFKKNIFLQNYDFIKEIKAYYKSKDLQINLLCLQPQKFSVGGKIQGKKINLSNIK